MDVVRGVKVRLCEIAKETGFENKNVKTRPPIFHLYPHPRQMAMPPVMFPKRNYTRSKKLLNAARGEACTWPGCGMMNGTVVAAHSNLLKHGKGIGKKADDLFIAFLCYDHHYELDHGKNLTKDQKEKLFLRAMNKTWERLYRLGLINVNENR